MLTEIALPEGTLKVRIGDIPKLFADALHPPVSPDTPRRVIELKKFPLTEDAKLSACGDVPRTFSVSLKPEDWSALAQIWVGLPNLELPIAETHWEPYRKAYESSHDSQWKRTWNLDAALENVHLKSELLRADTEEAYREEIQSAAVRGEIEPVNPNTLLPAPEACGRWLEDCILTIEALKVFAEKRNVGIRFTPLPDPLQVAPAPEGGILTAVSLAERLNFSIELRKELIEKPWFEEREFEALCLGVPPRVYCDRDELAPEQERREARTAKNRAIDAGLLYAESTGGGNSVYGQQWRIRRVQALQWAAGRFPKLPEWLLTPNLRAIWQLQDDQRAREGRYTLEEAAREISNNSGEDEIQVLSMLVQAVVSEALCVYRPGSRIAYRPNVVRPCYDETFHDELNRWLDQEKSISRINFRFSRPTRAQVAGRSASRLHLPIDSKNAARATNDWREQARQIADELFDHDTKLKCRDSLIGYANRVMEAMQERGIHGPRGRIVNPNTVKREALQGDKWWRVKHNK